MAQKYKKALVERQSIPLPERILCRVCTKWKAPEQYSNKELKRYTHQTARGARLTPITARLRCRVCAGGPLHELECLGPCAETKSINAFSKSARQNGGSRWCMACTLWKESAEPNVSVQAPPGGPNAEKRFCVSTNLGNNHPNSEAGDDESGDEFNANKIKPSRGHENASQSENPSRHSILDRLGSTQSSSSVEPKYLFNSFSTAYSDDDDDDDDNDDDDDDDGETQSSASNQWENFSFESASTLKKDLKPVTFNAWDPSGQQHVINAHSTSRTTDNSQPSNSVKSGWAKPVGSRNAGRIYRAEQSSHNMSERTLNFHNSNDDLIDL